MKIPFGYLKSRFSEKNAFPVPYRLKYKREIIDFERLVDIPDEEVEKAIEELGVKPAAHHAAMLKDAILKHDGRNVYMLIIVVDRRKLNDDYFGLSEYVHRLCTVYKKWPSSLLPIVLNCA